MSTKINFSIGFNVDKKELEKLQNELKSIQNTTREQFLKLNIDSTDLKDVDRQLAEINYSATTVQNALNRAFNAKLNTINIETFNKYLKDSDLTLEEVYNDFSKLGQSGQNAFRNLTNQILSTNTQLEKTNTFLDRMAETISNTIKWNIASSAVNKLTGEVEQAYGYVKNLDRSLNDIRIVTGQSADQMDIFAEKANNAAIALGKSTTDYTDAALIYYQQGLNEEEVAERARITLMAANVTGQTGQEVSEQLTAVWNGYKVTAEEAELYVDRLAVAAAATASDLEELSTGMSKVASTASSLGVTEEQLTSQLATIISVTRQAPESIGTALRSIYARMSDIESGVDDETTLGNYTEAMAQLGVNVLDNQGKLRDMGKVIEEVGENWTDYSREQQIALAQTMAGTRQFNNLIALFDNWDQYTSTLEQVNNAQGALQEQQDIYMESTRAHLNQLEAQWEDLFDSFLDTETINAGADALGSIVERVTNLVDALGGGEETIVAFGSILSRVFNDQIVKSINVGVSNVQTGIQNIKNAKEQIALASQIASSDSGYDDITKEIAALQLQYEKYQNYMTDAQKQELQNHIKNRQAILEQGQAWETAKDSLVDYYNAKVIGAGASDLGTRTITKQEFNSMNEDQLFELQSALEESERFYQEATSQAEKFKKTLTSTSTAIKTHSMNSNELKVSYGKIYQQLNQVIETSLDYSNALDQNSKEYQNIISLINQYNAARDKVIQIYGEDRVGEGLVKNQQAYKSLIALVNELTNTYSQNQEKAVEMNDVVMQAMARVDGIIQTGSTKSEKFIKGLTQPQTIQGIVNIGQGLASTVSTVQTLQSLGNIWSDETLSSNEKMEQGLMAIINLGSQAGMTISSIANAATTLSSALGIGVLGAGVAATGIAVGIPVLITLFIKLTSAAKEAAEAEKEAFSNSLKAIEENQSQIDELNAALEENKKKIQEINSQDIVSITDEQDIKNLEIENRLLESKIALLQKEQELENSKAKNDFENSYDSLASDINSAQTQTVQYSDAAKQAYIYGYFNEEQYGDLTKINAGDIEGFIEWKENYIELIEDLRREAAATNEETERETLEAQANYLEDALAQDESAWSELNKQYVNELESAAELAKDYLALNPEDEKGIKEAQNIIKDYYKAAGTYEETVSEGLSQVTQDNKTEWEEFQKSVSSFNFENIKGDNFEESLKEIIDNDNLFDALKETANNSGLSLEDFFAPLANDDGVIVLKDINEWINNIGEDAESNKSSVTDYLSSIRDISDAIAANEYESLDDDQLKLLKTLENEYKSLGDIQNKNSHEYLETLRQIGELIEDNHRAEVQATKDAANEKAKAALQNIKDLQKQQEELENAGITQGASDYKIKISAETDKLQEALKEALSAEYELKVKINAEDISSDVANAFAFSDEIIKIGDYLTEGLKVSIDEANEIVQAGYGAMLIGAEATADGMIQLQQSSVNAFIDGKQQEVEASRQAYISQLEQEATLVQAQIDSLDAEIEAVKQAKAAQTEEEANAALQNIETYHNQYLGYVEQLSAQLQADNDYSHQAGLVYSELEDYKKDANETALLNQQKNESDATTQQAQEINKRIQNLEKLYNALVSIGQATKESSTGPVTTSFEGGKATGGGGIVDSGDVQNKQQAPKKASEETKIQLSTEFNVDELLDEFKNNQEEYLDALEERETALEEQKAAEEETLGIIQGGIAALEAAPNYIDTKQKGEDQKNNKDPSAKEIDLYNDRLDIFSAINEEIEAYEANLKALQNVEEEAYGPKYSENLNKQLDIIKKLEEAQKKRLTLAKQQEGQLSQELIAAGFSFTETGALDRSQLTAMKNAYDEDAKKYNAMSGTQQKAEEGAALESSLDEQKKKIEAAEQLIDLWEEAQNEGNDALTELSSLEKETADIVDKLRPGEQIEELEYLVEIFEKFGDVTDIVNTKLSALEERQEHLAGADWFENLDEQIDTLNVKKLTTLVDSIKDLTGVVSDIKTAKTDFTSLIKELKNLANYNDKLSDLGINIDPDKINASADGISYIGQTLMQLINAYNSMESGQQANDLGSLISNIIGAASGNILSIVGLVANVISIVTNLVDTLRGLNDQIIELKIEKFNQPVEITLDLYSLQEQWNEFRREVIDDLEENDYLGKMAQSLREIQQYYNGLDFSSDSIFDPESLKASVSLIDSLSSHISSIMNEIKIMQGGDKSSIYGDHMADALEDLKTYTTELENTLIDVSQLEDEIYQNYLDSWDYIKDSLQDQLDEYDNILNEIEHNKNLISMLYGDDAYDQMDKFYELEEKANSGRLQYLNQTVKYWQEVKQKMEAAGETSGEAWDKVVENEKEAAEDLNNALEDAIQTIIDKYQNTIQSIFSEMTNNLTNGMGLDYVKDQWDLINQRADKYLDDINAAYEIQELQSKIQEAINDNDGDLEAQEQIKDVMDEQLEYLKEKDKLTEYDVERAEKLLDIELKKIALQNAQQNKSSMRLRRDANGNYTYEYVADEDAVQSAEEELAAAQNDLYNFDKDEYNSNLEEIYQIYQEYNDKMVQIASDNTLTEEQRQKYLLMLNEEYQEQITSLIEENEQIRNNLTSSAFEEYAALYNMSKEDFINMTEEEKNAFMSNLVETWNSGLQQMADAIAGEGGFQTIAEDALNQIKEAEDAYNESLEQTKEDLDGLDFTDFQESIDNILSTTENTISANEEVINTYDEMADSLIEMNKQQQAYLDSLREQNEALIEQIELANQLYAANLEGSKNDKDAPGWFQGIVDFIVPGAWIGDIVSGGKVSNTIYDWFEGLFGFDTGGYTGDWSNNQGKLAILHQKELVLNKDDTENILDTVDILRDSPIDLESYIANSMQNILNNLGYYSNPNGLIFGGSNNNSNEIKQTVQIEANFPNVSDSNEIKEAFNNLINIAAQRAMTNKV